MTKKAEIDGESAHGVEPATLKPDTRLVTGGRDPFAHHGFVNPPVYHASTVLYRSAEDMIAHRGRYVYGDFGSGTIWTLRVSGGRAAAPRRESIRVSGLSSFGEDAAGELYATSLEGDVYRVAR